MPKPRPDKALKTMLDERGIALWDAYHYKRPGSTSKTATSKDPVSVVLKTPEAPDMNFHGYGDTLEEAVRHALTFSFNLPLRLRESGLNGAMARLEAATQELWVTLLEDRQRRGQLLGTGDIDDDIPF